MGKAEQLLNAMNLSFIEGLYADYLRDPSSVSDDWRGFFAENFGAATVPFPSRRGPSFKPPGLFHGGASAVGNGRSAPREVEQAILQDRVDELVRAYRVRGHMVAQIDPLGLPRTRQPELDLDFYGLKDADLERMFSSDTISGANLRSLREIYDCMRNTYCRWIGVQFMHIDDISVRNWLQERMEKTENHIALSREEQIRILTRLTDAVIFEEFIQKKFTGAKSFSLEGAESLIPLLDLAIERAGDQGIDEIVIGMAHRGRLNVLANILGKGARQIFREFEDKDPALQLGRGDVKYHLGYFNTWTTTKGREVYLALSFNPSHLEFVNPVALGRMRAKQDRVGDREHVRGMTMLIHGDASFAGEGVVQETFNLSQLDGYRVGGTLHVIINNQIGFTTTPAEGRSSAYATDVAKMMQIPIFHVNGEDPEAVAQVVQLAMDFRRTFQRDVVIDMYCYRRHGHSESDEPTFTQPLMYRAIEQRPTVRESYLEHLLRLGGVTAEDAEKIVVARREHLEEELSAARRDDYVPRSPALAGIWNGYLGGAEGGAKEVDTAVGRGRLAELLELQTRLPDGFHPHPKINQLLKSRREMAAGARPLDWAAAEALAFASLACQKHRVRLSGQDSGRGTFSQRHAILHDIEDGRHYIPLQHLAPDQAPVEIYNSPLSELGVLGFEYGYSIGCPEGLVLWEAQFGDFCNAAQVIIDQFIVSAEDKWHRLSGIVLLLPHGLEGMGPEHSSARLERFLQLAAEDNIQVVNPTTPAQYFHCLRRQVLRTWRKPLIVMTPKSLLRHPQAVSALEELAQGEFNRILADSGQRAVNDVKRVLLCSGKVYYDLERKRDEIKANGKVAILRLEQLYPLPAVLLRDALAEYRDGTELFWVQEEPENMGAWRYLRVRFGASFFGRLPFSAVTRAPSSSPATGSASSHRWEHEQLLTQAFDGI